VRILGKKQKRVENLVFPRKEVFVKLKQTGMVVYNCDLRYLGDRDCKIVAEGRLR
jgi:hypothetical protein